MKIYAFPLNDDGTVAGPRRTIVDFGENKGCDGMTVDLAGHVYLTVREPSRPGILVVDPDGQEVAFIATDPRTKRKTSRWGYRAMLSLEWAKSLTCCTNDRLEPVSYSLKDARLSRVRPLNCGNRRILQCYLHFVPASGHRFASIGITPSIPAAERGYAEGYN